MKIMFYLIIASCLVYVSCNFAPGSYPYAEIYELQISEEDLIIAVEKFKEKNSEYDLPYQTRFIDGRRNEKDHWYHIWFYYSRENKIVKCWIRGKKLAFVGVGDGLNLDNYKEINKDFSERENQEQKEKFEKVILQKIKKYIH